jgi:phosphonate transport system substrate-binding protein
MGKTILGLLLFLGTLFGAESLVFGAITTVKPEIVRQHFTPLLKHLERKLGIEIRFDTGRDYDDTIQKFIDGTFDLGYIGPSPYVLATRRAPDSLRVIAGIENRHKPTFRAAIVTRKESPISSLKDLVGKRFAFGSRRSTLSYYLPYYMLMQSGVIDKLQHYDILGRHDIVAKNVIMGNYDAGGIKMSVADTYSRYLKKIALSEPVTDFAIVVHKSMDPQLARKIQRVLFSIDDPKILHSIKKQMTGFGPRKDSDYDRLREIMKVVDKHAGYTY